MLYDLGIRKWETQAAFTSCLGPAWCGYCVQLCISVDESESDGARLASSLPGVLDALQPPFSEGFTRSDTAAESTSIEFAETFQV